MQDWLKTHYLFSIPKDYIDSTFDIELSSSLYEPFEKHLKENALILDVGFCSGRDMVYFQKQGYQVEGIDLEDAFIQHGLELGLNVKKMNVLNFVSDKVYDGIWCNASLLHLKKNKIKIALTNLLKYLKPNGVIFASFKYGDFEGIRDGRYYTDLNENDIVLFPGKILETKISLDQMNRGNNWFNVYLTKD